MEKNDILKLIKVGSAITATGIAKSLGFTKASESLKNKIAELVNDGSIVEDTSKTYVTYSKSSQAKSITHESSIPADIATGTYGSFVVSATDDGKIKIFSKTTEKTYKLSKKLSLLVINDVVQEAPVKTADEVLAYIQQYIEQNKLVSIVVNDTLNNKQIGTKDDISFHPSHLMMLDIKKHNKAA